MCSRANLAESLLQSVRLTFNLKALQGRSKEAQDIIIRNWVKYNDYVFFFNFSSRFNSWEHNLFNKNTWTIDEVVKVEVDHLKTANAFLSQLILYSAFGREENKNQRWYNSLMIDFFESILDRTHPYFSDIHYLKKKPEYDEKLLFSHLNENTPTIILYYTAHPNYLIQGFTRLKEERLIEVSDIEKFVYTYFSFDPEYPRYIVHDKPIFKWTGEVRGSFPQLLGQLKKKKVIQKASYRDIANFVLQFLEQNEMKFSTALQYASLKEKLSEKNTIDYRLFTR